MRDRIEHALERWGHFAYRRAGWLIAGSLGLVLALATQLPNVTFDTSTEGFFSEDNPIRVDYDAFRERFGSDTQTLVASIHNLGADKPICSRKVEIKIIRFSDM